MFKATGGIFKRHQSASQLAHLNPLESAGPKGQRAEEVPHVPLSDSEKILTYLHGLTESLSTELRDTRAESVPRRHLIERRESEILNLMGCIQEASLELQKERTKTVAHRRALEESLPSELQANDSSPVSSRATNSPRSVPVLPPAAEAVEQPLTVEDSKPVSEQIAVLKEQEVHMSHTLTVAKNDLEVLSTWKKLKDEHTNHHLLPPRIPSSGSISPSEKNSVRSDQPEDANKERDRLLKALLKNEARSQL